MPGVSESPIKPREHGYSSNISIDTSSNVQSQGLDDSLRPNLDSKLSFIMVITVI